ncbi:LAME_0G04874g1_1 [Lachancea meyersii CBS 8951]|uniref:LAME_0G04874g1_1 n=1 Tax=Lachancea meyersii CBS 8951 TaxID=1266667 RepID=A0A1G4K712_9SACH|nr:LAME_0G04874g1_1 [Lachancea meyersii CBS 8951]
MELPDDLASAVRKSWSEPVVPEGADSPIGTPRSTPRSSEGGSISVESDTPVDYQLLKHHYAITDDDRRGSVQGGVLDILGGLDPAVCPAAPQNTRRKSIEEVSKIRQWLNPRSSFSGVSPDEPNIAHGTAAHKCWVTAIESQDDYWPILVLQHSLMSCGSRYKLLVLYTEQNCTIATQLAHRGVEILKAAEVAPILVSSSPSSPAPTAATATSNATSDLPLSSRWFKLLPFVSLANAFDLVCYLSPRSIVLSNIDELLDSEVVSSEIDNETCVLLSNSVQPSPTVIVLRPNKEIEACIREYMTVYTDAEKNSKWAKLRNSDGAAVLRELFQDSWGIVASEYCYSGLDSVPAHAKLVECCTTQPWNASDNTSMLWKRACGQLNPEL